MSRQAAWACLRSGSPAPLREVETFAAERELDARDTALVRRLVGMELRRRGTLRALVRTFAHKNLKPRLAATLDDRIRPGLVKRAKELTDGGNLQAAYALEQKAKSLRVEQFAPDREVGDEHEFDHGGVKVVLRHFGWGHTDNDLVVHLPDLKILHTGDLLFHHLHPFVDRNAKATTRGWQKCLTAMQKLCDESTVVVPGHGEVTNAGGLTDQHDYFEETRKAVEDARRKKMSKEDVTDLEVERFRSYGFARMRGRTLGTIFDELEAGE